MESLTIFHTGISSNNIIHVFKALAILNHYINQYAYGMTLNDQYIHLKFKMI